MPAGMATAVPKPAMPSMNPPKHQAMSRARIRRSLEMEVIICPITSMAPVLTHRLYVNTAAMMTSTMGHRAMRKPSRLALATCPAGMPHHAMASAQEMTNDPIAAFHAGHLKTSSMTTNHRMGASAKTNAIGFMPGLLSPRRRASGSAVSRSHGRTEEIFLRHMSLSNILHSCTQRVRCSEHRNA